MKLVGEKLESYALSEKDDVKKDLFGRSAFNRYYYAAFLITREMLGEFDSKWQHTPHKNIPDLLEKSVRKLVIKHLRLNEKKKLITKGELSASQTKLNIGCTELANLLRQAYDVRLVADYEPENVISTKNKVITLSSCKLTSANNWSNKASAHCKNIRSVWRSAGLA